MSRFICGLQQFVKTSHTLFRCDLVIATLTQNAFALNNKSDSLVKMQSWDTDAYDEKEEPMTHELQEASRKRRRLLVRDVAIMIRFANQLQEKSYDPSKQASDDDDHCDLDRELSMMERIFSLALPMLLTPCAGALNLLLAGYKANVSAEALD